MDDGLAASADDGTDLGGKAKDDGTDQTPAWSELKTKAGKERKRLPLACIACRRKKIRCSGEKPACKHCLRSRIPCVYKVTTRKAAPRTDYMAMLDKRLKRMEERILKVVPKKDIDSPASCVTRAVLKPVLPGTANAKAAAVKKRGPADDPFKEDLESWANAPSKTRPDGTEKPTSLRIQEAEENKLLAAGADALPPKDIQEHLAEVFFENVYGQAYHLLHKPSYMRKLRHVLCTPLGGTLPPVLVLSVCAIAARFSNHPKLNTTPNFLRGEEWASHAREICTARYEWPNITILTCLLILGLHEFGTCQGGRSWALGGQAIRMAFALQLHKDLEHDPLNQTGSSKLSFIDREIRRRTMWACFLMDRFNSSGTDRPTFIREETIKIPLPIKEKYFQLDMPAPTETLSGDAPAPDAEQEGVLLDAKENMGVAAYMIKTIALWGRVITYLNQGGRDLDPHPLWHPQSVYTRLIKEADELLASLPTSLIFTTENLRMHETEKLANQFLFLHIALQQNILFLSRVSVASPMGAAPDVAKDLVSKAGAKTFAAANRISEILKEAGPYMVSAPFMGYCAFSSATVHIMGIFSGNPTVEAASRENLAINVKYLSKMKRYWGMFHWMSENLREQYRSCADAAHKGVQSGERKTTAPIFQYGDWFDRYPHGVSQADFGDPANHVKKERGEDAVLEQKPELSTVEEFFTSLSPPHSTEGNPASRTSKKRKAPGQGGQAGKKASSQPSQRAGSDPQQQPPTGTDFRGPAGLAEQHALSAPVAMPQQRRSLSEQMADGANGSGPYNMLQLAHARESFHAMSPVSPVGGGHFGPPQGGGAFYSHGLLPMSLGQQANPGVLQPLDRQLVFGAYSMDPGVMPGQPHHQGANDLLEGLANWDGLPMSAPGRPNVNGHMVGGNLQQQQQQFSVYNGEAGEASSAWFMPFNMEPPEIGDLGLNMDAFGGVFGGMNASGSHSGS
ncbi:fungal-specific transcription factor [Plectosphaerella plurivora]|uniref:Fungal-specific transcription factor n=1 Tax=Plectosphaerella plurivora TaxID=936078 RepID=A0A9P9AFX7_9PEZI|nr:fungal-specific transcription factor [Plectosphaerella plurivora]